MAAVGAHLACSLAMPFLAMHFIRISWPLRSFAMIAPLPSGSVMTGEPTHSFGLLAERGQRKLRRATESHEQTYRFSPICRSFAYSVMISSPVHRALSVRVTLQYSQYCSQSQSRV